MPCQFEHDVATNKGTIWFKKGAQIVTTKSISGATVGFDSGGVMVNAIFPNVNTAMSLAGLPFATADDKFQVINVLNQHNRKTGG